MHESREEVVLILIISTAIILLLGGVVVTVLFTLNKRKYKHKAQLSEMKSHYEKILLQTRLKIIEDTYRAISQNLHDNIGSNISTAMLLLYKDEKMSVSEQDANRIEALGMLDRIVDDLRNIAHSLNPDYLDKIGLNEAIKQRMDQLVKTKKYVVELNQSGTNLRLEKQKQLVLYYIFQEAINNINNHSQANRIIVQTRCEPDELFMMIKDDGVGMDIIRSEPWQMNGAGILNMKKHAELIGAQLDISSEPGKGLEIIVRLQDPYQ